jgi:hypothetical protein
MGHPVAIWRALGMARAVIGTDKRGGRLVSNVSRIEVCDVDGAPRGGT